MQYSRERERERERELRGRIGHVHVTNSNFNKIDFAIKVLSSLIGSPHDPSPSSRANDLGYPCNWREMSCLSPVPVPTRPGMIPSPADIPLLSKKKGRWRSKQGWESFGYQMKRWSLSLSLPFSLSLSLYSLTNIILSLSLSLSEVHYQPGRHGGYQ